jgi:chromosome segregation ATPase
MSVVTSAEARDRVVRWLEEGQGQLSTVLAILHDYDRLQGVASAAEQECERLRTFVYENERLRNQVEALESECAKLRDDMHHLRGLSERHLREREDIAASLSQLMNDVLIRLRGEPR